MRRYSILLILGLMAALFLNQGNHLLLFPATLMILIAADLALFRHFLRWKLFLSLSLLVLVPTLLVGPRNAAWAGIPYNSTMLGLNLLMMERSLLILLAIKLFTQHLPVGSISRGLIRLRLYQFDRVFHLSLDLLPEMRTMVTSALHRWDWRQVVHRRAGFFQLLSQLIAQIVFRARNVASAIDHHENS